MTSGIIVDSSALIAVLFGEPECDAITSALLQAPKRSISAFSVLETAVVALSRKGRPGLDAFDALCREFDLAVIPLSADDTRLALTAWERFGKGRHPAALNLGDLCSYALAIRAGQPLLCKGRDFSQTNLDLVAY